MSVEPCSTKKRFVCVGPVLHKYIQGVKITIPFVSAIQTMNSEDEATMLALCAICETNNIRNNRIILFL